MDINFKEIVLNQYGGFKLKADVDEAPEDIIAAVLYNDHGDDFLVIKTDDTVYKYSLFATRMGWDVECLNDENHWQRKRFDKVPQLTGQFDAHCETGNQIYLTIKSRLYSPTVMFSPDSFEKCLPEDAQALFNWLYSDLKRFYESKVVYHSRSSDDILKFLALNNILSEENLQKLEEMKVFLREDTIDGSAGKIKCDPDYPIYGDDIHWIWYRGEQVTKKFNRHGIKVKRYWIHDEFGGYGFHLNMRQFKRPDFPFKQLAAKGVSNG